MRFAFTLSAIAFLAMSAETRADSRVFIVANQPDGYGIDVVSNSTSPPAT